MKMLPTTTAVPITAYPQYVANCRRNAACDPPYLAPLPAVEALQLYVDLGTTEPLSFELWLLDLCDPAHTEQVIPGNYVLGQTPEGGWYGVFKYPSAPLSAMSSFVAWLQVEVAGGSKTFFSQALVIEPCLPLMKVAACYPEDATTTGFDSNDVYYGLPEDGALGNPAVRYFHVAYVRYGKRRELANKATFKSSLVRNFRTTLERTWLLETELVPQWYKDVLLAIYLRGVVKVDGTSYLVSDLAFEALNDDDRRWKPFAQLKETRRLYFGCDESVCSDCCTPTITFLTAVGGVVPGTDFIIDADGTALVNTDGTNLIHT